MQEAREDEGVENQTPAGRPQQLLSPMIWESIHAQRDFFKYHVPVAKVLGITDAIFVCFLIWKQYRQEDMIELLAEDIEAGTGLSYEMQKGIRKRLRANGVLEEKTLRLQHKTFYRINGPKLDQLLESELPPPEQGKPSVGSASLPGSIIQGKNTEKNIGKPEGAKAPPGESEHQKFIDLWHEVHIAQFGQAYAMTNPGADCSAAKKLLAVTHMRAGELIAIVTAAWSRSGKGFWACENQTSSIRKFVSNYSAIISELDRIPHGGLGGESIVKKAGRTPPPGLKPFSQRPPPGLDEHANTITADEYARRFPLSLYYDEQTFKPLG